ncbi:MAG: restriction endonuclease [Thermoleophilia bacterium]|nr:restriction endonuclease [Thermoleophilia bacterium]
MGIPGFQALMKPLLEAIADGREYEMSELVERLANQFNLTEEERNQLIPSGGQTVFANRVGWARTYLKQAGLLGVPRNRWVMITERGRQVLEQNPPRIDVYFLRQFPEFLDFEKRSRGSERNHDGVSKTSTQTPEEVLEAAYDELCSSLISRIYESVRALSPRAFERLIVALLIKMGYGGADENAGQVLGGSGDEGIDGIIRQDPLGLETIYLQAKQWQGTVGRPEVQKFVGALQGKRAKKGVFITTSDFTQDASRYAEGLETKVILIDGQRLAKLMFIYNVGVSTARTIEIKRIDSDYFAELEGISE